MAAQTVALLTLCRAAIIWSPRARCYGGTYSQFAVTFAQFGIDVTFVDGGEPENFRSALRDNTKALYTETIGNPQLDVATCRRLRDRARSRRAARRRQHARVTISCAGRSSTAPTSLCIR